MSTTSTTTSADTATATHSRGRHAWALAWIPPNTGPAATAPKMHTLKITAVDLSFSAPKPSASGGTAAISSKLVHSPCRMWPAMNIAGSWAAANSTAPIRATVA